LVGHSLGGAVAQELAGNSPERILTLTLVAPAPPEGLQSLQNISNPNAVTKTFQFLDRIGLRKTMHRLSFKKTMPGLRNNKTYLNMIVEDALIMDIKAFDGFLKTLKNWRGTQYLKHLTFPVLIIYGDLDTVIPPQELECMQQQIKNCRSHNFQNIGHSPQLESDDSFNKLLYAFINGDAFSSTTHVKMKKKSSIVSRCINKIKRLLN